MSYTFRGFTFDRVISVSEKPPGQALQENIYNGLDGIEVVRLGERKGIFFMSGWIISANATAHTTTKNSLRALMDKQTGTLVNHDGESFENVILQALDFSNRITSGNGIEEDFVITFDKIAPNA